MERILKRLQPGHNGFQFIVEPQVREELSPIVLFDASMLEQHGNGLQFRDASPLGNRHHHQF